MAPSALVWLVLEFARPPVPLKAALAISLISFVGWLLRPHKQWGVQSWWFIALLAVIAVGIPLAPNTYSAFSATRTIAVLFFCACLPLQSVLTSVERVRLVIYTFLGISLYVGGWAAFHGGMGPAGGSGSQDENYVDALMGMAIPFAYFPLFVEKRRIVKLLLAASLVVFVAAIALGGNPSRGGFIGLCAVALYCLARSHRKLLGVGLFAVLVISLLLLAGPGFWAEIRTTTDTTTGTADLRLEIWKAGLRMWQANPLLGVGEG